MSRRAPPVPRRVQDALVAEAARKQRRLAARREEARFRVLFQPKVSPAPLRPTDQTLALSCNSNANFPGNVGIGLTFLSHVVDFVSVPASAGSHRYQRAP